MIKNEKLEKLTKTIQTYLNNKTSLLIGSGASIPYGLPSMGDLAKTIKTKLNDQYKNDTQWKEFIKCLDNSGNFETTLDNVELNKDIYKRIVWTIWELIEQKDREALTHFISKNKRPALSQVLKKFVQKTDSTNIITTNYDRLIEYSIDFASGKTNTGFLGNYIKRFIQSTDTSHKRYVNLFKVHGSIDWFKNIVDNDIISMPFFNKTDLSSSYEPLIVTPGNEKYKETHKDPFRTVISKADIALRESQAYLCIGYGFNDEHIQPIILDENKNNKKQIVIVTKDITPKIKELFFRKESDNCLIISEGDKGIGCKVTYTPSESVQFSENYWQLDKFFNLWF